MISPWRAKHRRSEPMLTISAGRPCLRWIRVESCPSRARTYSRSYLHWRGDEKVYRAITFDRNRAATADHQTGRRPPHGQCWVLAGVAHPWRGAEREVDAWLNARRESGGLAS